MEFRPMRKFAVFVVAVIVRSHLVFSANARPMKFLIGVSAMHKADHPQPNAEQVLPPSIPLPAKTSGFGESVRGFKDDFRPTAPGNSPGIGHSFEEDNDERNEEKGASFRSTNGKHAQDFKRTSPGHSPGVGHVFSSKISKKNV
ncbi:uncharacterized protein LOC108482803 [Gossypium arboreum]|uniref:Uncharacterized protein n=1 Tax=Gossypium arboreum TaxID=29729 RepID=A0ABR0MY45_GOSAR|nr:uncharacterized protein LOC108482803 [Gossypium arboreum]KAK5783047.1 hypothetical protein PVK06_037555 [Gossypium arboreum]